MKELFKKTATSIIISSIAAFIIGLIMVVAPGVSLQTMGLVAGIYIIIHGIVLMALAFSTHTIYTPFFWRNVWFTIYHIGRRSCFDAKHIAGYLYYCIGYMDYIIKHQCR